jgi:hypothetical protein
VTSYPEWIMERAFGGTQVADASGGQELDGCWPRGKAAPAASDCCALLLMACKNRVRTKPGVMVFLVGGAGNGKSFLAKQFTSQLRAKKTSAGGVFASRSYDYELENGGFLRVVNDATIPRADADRENSGLVADVRVVLENEGFLLACVNRGILVNEVNKARKRPDDKTGGLPNKVVNWLLSGRVEDEAGDGQGQRLVPMSNEAEASAGYYAACKLLDGGDVVATVHVAFMDHVSLLEPLPMVQKDGMVDGGVRLSPRPVTMVPILGREDTDSPIPILAAMQEFYVGVERCMEGEAYPGSDLDPLRSNLNALLVPGNLQGLGSILRGAEVISGGRITYRDAWGLAVLALVGANPKTNLQGYAEWVSITSSSAVNHSLEPEARLTALVELALRRTHMALFSARGPRCLFGDAARQPSYPSVPSVRALAAADPLFGLDETIKGTVLRKLTLLENGRGPGEALAEEDARFARIWTPLDKALECALLEWLDFTEQKVKFTSRNEVLSWYGQYLYRLYSLARGYPAHARIVDRWQRAWMDARTSTLKQDLNDGLNRIVFRPYEDPHPRTLLPLFAPRISPIAKGDGSKRAVLEVDRNQYQWSLKRGPDSLSATLSNYQLGDKRRAEFMLDFCMLKEVLAQAQGAGFTDGADDIEPRIERLRAEVLSIEVEKAASLGVPVSVKFVQGDTLLG